MTRPARLDVVVPAHDEEDAIAPCLLAIADAVRTLGRAHPDVEVAVTIVLDGCTDRTAAVLRAAATADPLWGTVRLAVIETERLGVGRARAVGTAAALADGPVPSERWLAHTDADSRVDRGWLVQQVEAHDAGAHVLVGAVVPDPDDLEPVVLARWEQAHPPGSTLGHVHGANLGVRGDVSLALGGFDPVPEHEDVRLVERARALGFDVRATTELPVVTSGRFDGRTPGGYAEHLRRTYGDAS
ncbi:glycosyltransferase family 2 protein [Curtobacterium pusillum]|uniref:glycosyltransferase n=1 Tax=Curtobacterium pusillum TaxID=69373 RepID=UPI0021B64061|nr:glycosyltransferase [Curtobacterium pusillum]